VWDSKRHLTSFLHTPIAGSEYGWFITIHELHGKGGSKNASQNGQNGEASSDLLSWAWILGHARRKLGSHSVRTEKLLHGRR